MMVGSTSRSTEVRGVKCAPSLCRSAGSSARTSSVPKIAGSTSRQSACAASISSWSWSAVSGSATGCSNRPPLKWGTATRSATEKPPLAMVRHSSSTRGGKLAALRRESARSWVNAPLGSRLTSSANMVNRQRIRKPATSAGACPGSNDCASRASRSAISRVTRALRRAGSRLSGSSQAAASRARTSGSARSSRLMR